MSAADVAKVNALKLSLSRIRAASTAHATTYEQTESHREMTVLLEKLHVLAKSRLVTARERLTKEEQRARARGAAGGHQP